MKSKYTAEIESQIDVIKNQMNGLEVIES